MAVWKPWVIRAGKLPSALNPARVTVRGHPDSQDRPDEIRGRDRILDGKVDADPARR